MKMIQYLDAILGLKVSFGIFIVWAIQYYFKIKDLPAGPWGLPIIGYAPWMGKYPYKTFIRLQKKYGGIFSLNLAGETVVVLNDWPSIKAAIGDQGRCFSGRPKTFMLDQLIQRKDMAFSDGPIAMQQRNLMIKCMKGVGLGKKSMETAIIYEIHDLIDTFDKHQGSNVSMATIFMKPTIKILWSMISSYNFDDDELEKFNKLTNDIAIIFGSDNPVNFLPMLRFIPPFRLGYKKALSSHKQLFEYLTELVNRHQLNRNQNTNRDFIDLYLDEIESTKSSSAPYNVEHLVGSLWNIIIGGQETSISTCQWTFLYLAYYPKIQTRIQDEIESVIGRDRMPTLDDVSRLPYLQATILEVYRYSTVVPLSIPHRTMEDTKLLGYNIPKNTTILQNMYAVHFDPNLWENPRQFNSERFLDENNKINRPPFFMPFSIGPRLCIGETVFEMEFRLIVSSLLQKFTFSLPKGLPKPTLEENFGFNIKPFAFSLHVVKR